MIYLRRNILFVFLLIWGIKSSNSFAADGEMSATRLFSKYSDSIVLIGVADREEKNSKIGSGFVVDESGVVATNYHLIQGAQRIIVKFRNNRAYKNIRVIAVDKEKDIALLNVRAEDLKAVKLGNSRSLKIGERVIAIGNPLGLENTISDGLISSFRTTDSGAKLLQISVPLSSGSSGGPLFDLEGKVVGMTTASNAKGQNLNFAIPINDVKALIRQSNSSTQAIVKKNSAIKESVPLALKNSSKSGYYIVRPGESMYRIAKKFNTSISKIKELNNLDSSKVHPGQRLKITE